MQEKNNSFKDLEAKWGAELPPELERRVSSQTTNFAVFGRVVELFMPNALQAAAHMIGGGSDSSSGPQSNDQPGRRPVPEAWPDWRTPPK
ncbi:MAG: hypothetical protein ACKVU2_08610 [Saprospiraceae bacterium]